MFDSQLNFTKIAGYMTLSVVLASTASCVLAQEMAHPAGAKLGPTSDKGIPAIAATLDVSNAITAKDSEQWVKAEVLKSLQAKQKPISAEKTLLQWLQAGKFVTDISIMSVVNGWISYENLRGNAELRAADNQYKDSHRIIDEVMVFTYGRPDLGAKLHEAKAYLARVRSDAANEVKEYEKVVQPLSPLNLDIDLRAIEGALLIAQRVDALGDKARAESLYMKVLSYPWWYQYENQGALRRFRDLYIEAGKGLIGIRRHDLAALKRLSFIPSTDDELMPILKDAIRKAELGQSTTNE